MKCCEQKCLSNCACNHMKFCNALQNGIFTPWQTVASVGGGGYGLVDYSGNRSHLFCSHVMLPSNMKKLLLRENSFGEYHSAMQ